SSRTLTSRDAGTTNAMLPVNATEAPLHLKTGDRITIATSGAHAQVTLTIVGFYLDASRLAAEPIQVDRRLVAALSAGTPPVAILAHLDPTTAAATLAHLQDVVPSAQVRSLADQQAAVTANVDNAITVLIAVASLALLAGLIIIANAVALALLERRRDVGILKAVGQTSRGVLGEVLVETGVVGFTGAVLALLLVAVATPLLGALLFGASFGVPLLDVLLIVPATTLVCMLVAAGVAWRATHVRPLEVLRYE
ncbi:MAG TPA: ABC transporter permease, partial [Chloroflexota bacterium]|nr:ABC transporter permease [Chloroflexota bacterium]